MLVKTKTGTIDVEKNSEAKYLEIRTTAKAMNGNTREYYINAFEAGLNSVNFKGDKKLAHGLLSLDRTIHTIDDAADFIQRVLKSTPKVPVGLDISANPFGRRTRTGKDLARVVSITSFKADPFYRMHFLRY